MPLLVCLGMRWAAAEGGMGLTTGKGLLLLLLLRAALLLLGCVVQLYA